MQRVAIISALVLGISASGCGLIKIKLKPQTIEQSGESNNTTNGGCLDTGPITPIQWDISSITKDAQGCLESDTKISLFGEVLELDETHRNPDSCQGKGIHGKWTNTVFKLDYTYKNDKGETVTENFINQACNPSTVDMATDGPTIAKQFNDCLDQIEANHMPAIIKALNRRPQTLTFSGAGSCDPDSCFYIKYNVKLRIDGGTANTNTKCE
ncbi:MAG: hypothetical protein IT381_01055 [Deltaproteobacteria bacterium]|nr:hypothetical protein [Deltaproteobacteria bacterium]